MIIRVYRVDGSMFLIFKNFKRNRYIMFYWINEAQISNIKIAMMNSLPV